MGPKSFLLIVLYIFLNSVSLEAQVLKGKVLDEDSSSPLSGQAIVLNNETYFTDASGKFQIPNKFEEDKIILTIDADGYVPYELELDNSEKATILLGIIFLGHETGNTIYNREDNYTVDLDILEGDDSDLQVSGLLSAAWDPFSSIAGYNFGVTRFNPRGLNQNHSLIYLNGAPFNNLGDGRFFYSLWGGLNDAFRTKYSQHGLNTTDFSIGGFSGTQDIDLRATTKRAGTKITVDHSNRSYQYRTMISHNSGVQENGWSYAINVSRRWGNGGYVEGTYYDGYGYFVSVDKAFNDTHSLNALVFASPTVRGRGSASTQELYDLLDNNYYNPNWGYQDGKVRNSREYRTHQPVFMLRHDYQVNDLSTLTTTVALQTGKFGSTRLGWLEAADPRPDYYGNLPYDNRDVLSEETLQDLVDQYSDPSVSQLNWDEFYQINRERQYEINDISGDPSNNTTENISAYVLEEQRFDNTKAVINTNLVHQLNSDMILKTGVTFQYDRNHNFKVLDDLLGGSYYIDIDGFALRGSNDPMFIQNDLSRPNRLLKEGDRYGYDYYKHIQNTNAWSTLEISLPKIDFSVSGRIAQTRFWREGLMENGKFPGTGSGLHSLGKSDVASFLHGTAKLGATYKINGRNYVYANAGYMTRAPFSRNAFESPDTRNSLFGDLTTEKIMGGELGYVLRHPRLNARITGFYNSSKDEIRSASFYLVNLENTTGAFANLLSSGISTINYGVEIGLDFKLTKTLSIRYGGAIGEYYYNSRPDLALTIDNNGEPVDYNRLQKSYLKDFNLPSIPQIAHTMDLRYESPNYWSATLSASYFDDMYIDANPVRRTTEVSQAVLNVTDTKGYEGLPKNDLLTEVVAQEKFDDLFKLDLYVRKSFKWGDYRLAANVSVENILNTTTQRIGGYEQLRFDYEGLDADRWAARYYYAYGTTYRVGVTFSF